MISIVMAYFNRLPQLEYTLKTIEKSNFKDYEIIIVDDFSNADQDPCLLCGKYNNLKIIKMSDFGPKQYPNPCVAYNIAFRESKGDKIIIQNPECCHIGDVLSCVNANINDSNYLSFSCLSLNKTATDILQQSGMYTPTNQCVTEDGGLGWYNHPQYRPCAYHFTSGISRKNLIKLNGFDERFAIGWAWDDLEILERIKRLKLQIQFVTNPMVIHQYHYSFKTPNLNTLIKQDNRALMNIIMKEDIIKAPNKLEIKAIE